jgi:ribosomal protein S8
MIVTDPIADYLTRIRNAQMAGHKIVEIPSSNMKKSITEILYDHGYILKYHQRARYFYCFYLKRINDRQTG